MDNNIIEKIISVDRAARSRTNDADKKRRELVSSIPKKRQELQDRYIENVKVKTAKLAEQKNQDAENAIIETEKIQHEQLLHLNEQYKKHNEKWVSDIVAKVTEVNYNANS